MKVLSAKPELSSPSSDSIQSSHHQSTSPGSFFDNLIAQASQDQTVSTDKEDSPDDKIDQASDDNSDQQTPDQTNFLINNPILDQLNKIDLQSDQSKKPETDLVQAEIKQNAPILPQATKPFSNTIMQQQAAAQVTSEVNKQAAPSAQLQQMNLAKQMPQLPAAFNAKLNTGSADTKAKTSSQTFSVKTDSSQLIPNVLLQDQEPAAQTTQLQFLNSDIKPVSKDLLALKNDSLTNQKTAGKTSKLNFDVTTLIESKKPGLTDKQLINTPQIQLPSDQNPIASPAMTDQINNPVMTMQTDSQMKHIETFSQLGHFINNQIANHINSGESASLGLSKEHSAYTQVTNMAKQTDYLVQVEMPAQTADALVKQGYDAKIRIYPPELGHVMAKLRVDKNNVQLEITTENQRVKEIVSANLNQLRDHFQQADINVTNIQVQTAPMSKEQSGSYQNPQEQAKNQVIEYTNDQNSKDVSPSQSVAKTSNTIIDTYA